MHSVVCMIVRHTYYSAYVKLRVKNSNKYLRKKQAYCFAFNANNTFFIIEPVFIDIYMHITFLLTYIKLFKHFHNTF